MGSIFSTGRLDWLSFILCGLVPPPFNILVHMGIRTFKYNGSLDRWYLYILALFSIFPFSFIPLLGLFVFDGILDGKGLNPIDISLLFPIIVYILVSTVPELMEIENSIFFTFLKVLFIFLSILGINIYRRYANCNKDQLATNKCDEVAAITFSSIGKASMDSIVQFGIAVLLILIKHGIKKMTGHLRHPIAILAFGAFNLIPDFVMWSIGFTFGSYIINSINNQDICNFCISPYIYTMYEIFPAVGSIFLIIIHYIFQYKFSNKKMNSNIREKYTKNNRVQELEELINELAAFNEKSEYDGEDDVNSKHYNILGMN